MTSKGLRLSRDPAATVETVVQVALGVLFALSLRDDISNAWSAAVVAVGGFITSAWVARDKLLPSLVGAIKAVFALVVTLGVAWPPNVETGVIMAVSAAVTFWLRSQVTAPIAEDGSRVPKLAVTGRDGAFGITSARKAR